MNWAALGTVALLVAFLVVLVVCIVLAAAGFVAWFERFMDW